MAVRPDASQLYHQFMQEISDRLHQVKSLTVTVSQDTKAPTAMYQAELAYLQVRFICELIALASLSAHYSLGIQKDLIKLWRADEIFERLEDINPHSFPYPVKSSRKPDGGLHFDAAPDRAMTRLELKSIYGQCGNSLHRGVLKHALASNRRVYDLNQVARWAGRISTLLAEHAILFAKEGKAVFVSMNPEGTGRVLVAHAEASGPFAVS